MNKESLYGQLKKQIFNEEITPGTWLIEREISEKYEVSRTPVREVLRVLATDGLIILEPNKGYCVRKLSFEELIEIFHARESVEGMLTRLACAKADEKFRNVIELIENELEEIDIESNPSLGFDVGHKQHDAM